MKVGLGAAVYLSKDEHFRLAVESVESAVSTAHELRWVFGINHCERPEWREWLAERGEVFDTGENNVSRAWNGSIRRLFIDGCDYAVIPNLDVRFKSNAIDRLVALAESRPDLALITPSPTRAINVEDETENEDISDHPAFCCFLIRPQTIDKVGWFDEEFHGAYDEDLDYHYRLALAGERGVVYGGSRLWHYGSGTMHHDIALSQAIAAQHSVNDGYFRRKWGHKPVDAANPDEMSKMYKTPFDA